MSIQFNSTIKAAKNVIFSESNTYYQRYKNIKTFIFNYFWQYFYPNKEAIFVKLIIPIILVNRLLSIIIASGKTIYETQALQTPIKTLKQQRVWQNLLKKQIKKYFKKYVIYRNILK